MTLLHEAPSGDSITDLLVRIRAGDSEARSILLTQVYAELRRLAASCMRQERQGHTLQPTALVNEAFIRMSGDQDVSWQNKSHFMAMSAHIMRQILVDHARARLAQKRGGNNQPITLSEELVGLSNPLIDVLAVHEAIEKLAALDARQAQIVEMRFFAGLSLEEIAPLLNLSVRTVKRDWTMARAWLHAQLSAKS